MSGPGFLARLRGWHFLLLGSGLIFVFFYKIIFHTSFFWEDFLYQFYPYRTFASVGLLHGQIPLWNPFSFCGMPFAADITGAVFYSRQIEEVLRSLTERGMLVPKERDTVMVCDEAADEIRT